MHTFVIGAGFAGLGMAIKLQEAGEPTSWSPSAAATSAAPGATTPTRARPATSPRAVLLLVRAQPGLVAVFSPQPEIQAYIQRVAEESGVLDRFLFDAAVEDARWDDATATWHVSTRAGDWTADVLV